MNLEISERDVIHILNCINICTHFLKYHTRETKDYIQYYYNFDNYIEDYTNLMLIHRRMSTKANMEYYNVDNYNLFIGQRDYLNTKDKTFKSSTANKNIKQNNKRKNNFSLINYFKRFFK